MCIITPVTDFPDIDTRLAAWIDAHRPEIIQAAQGLLRIPSVKGTPAPGAPFGADTRRALDYALSVAQAQGLTVKHLDGYAAHAEWTAPSVAPDAPIVGVLAHVDVVPTGDGWTSPPFAADIVDGNIVARGAIDDKGPAIAALFAIAALRACDAPLTHRLRLILGADEESGFGCVKHYFAREEMPVTGFTPDAEFPLIYAEKGIANAVLTAPLPPPSLTGKGAGELGSLRRLTGGLRPNMVPDRAEAVLEHVPAMEAALARLNAVVGIHAEPVLFPLPRPSLTGKEAEGLGSGNQIHLTAHGIHVTAHGVSAHGSTPDKGLNAVGILCDALLLLPNPDTQAALLTQIRDFAQGTTGAALGIDGMDDIAGPLTCSLGLAEWDGEEVALTFNIRYPVTWDKDTLTKRLEAGIAGTEWELTELSDHQPPLYVPQDDPLTRTLLSVYRDATGDTSPPQTMGGGTYARAMARGVAFGAHFPGSHDPGPHEKNEAWPVDDLLRAAKIYASALARLGSGPV